MKQIKIYLIYSFFLLSCSANSGFQFYSIDGNKINLSNRKQYYNDNVQLFFDRDEIAKEYTAVNVIASNHHYYGDFFFDERATGITPNLPHCQQEGRTHPIQKAESPERCSKATPHRKPR